MPDFTLARPEDAVRLAGAEADSTAHPWQTALYASSLASEHEQVWLMSEAGVLQGAAVLMQVLDEAHLQNFFIHRPWQGQGLGRQLLAQVILQARQKGASCLFLEVRQGNHAARHLYSQAGFVAYHQRKAYYPGVDGGREDAILMKATL